MLLFFDTLHLNLLFIYNGKSADAYCFLLAVMLRQHWLPLQYLATMLSSMTLWLTTTGQKHALDSRFDTIAVLLYFWLIPPIFRRYFPFITIFGVGRKIHCYQIIVATF